MNVILAFGVVFQVGSLILGVTILAIGIGMQDLVTCVGVARAGKCFWFLFFLFGDWHRHARALVIGVARAGIFFFVSVFFWLWLSSGKLPIGMQKTLLHACRCLPPPLRRACYAPADVDGQACHSAD